MVTFAFDDPFFGEEPPYPTLIREFSYVQDCIAFPVLLVAQTYVLTWLRFQLDRRATLTMTGFSVLALFRFFIQVVLKSEKEDHNSVFISTLIAIHDLTSSLLWLALFYYLK